jgi:hypothetical protein
MTKNTILALVFFLASPAESMINQIVDSSQKWGRGVLSNRPTSGVNAFKSQQIEDLFSVSWKKKIVRKVSQKLTALKCFLSNSFFFRKDMRLFFKGKNHFFHIQEGGCWEKKVADLTLFNYAYSPYMIKMNMEQLKDLFWGENLKKYLISQESHQKPVIFYVKQKFWQTLNESRSDWLDKVAQTNILLIGDLQTSGELLKNKTIYKNLLCLAVSQDLDLGLLRHQDLKNTEINFYQEGHELDFVQKAAVFSDVNITGMHFCDISFLQFLDVQKNGKNIFFQLPFLKKVIACETPQNTRVPLFFDMLSKWAPQLESLAIPSLDLKEYSEEWERVFKNMKNLKALHLRRINDAGSMCLDASTPQLQVLDACEIRSDFFLRDTLLVPEILQQLPFCSETLIRFFQLKNDKNCRIQCQDYPMIHYPFFEKTIHFYLKQDSWNKASIFISSKTQIDGLNRLISQSRKIQQLCLFLTSPVSVSKKDKMQNSALNFLDSLSQSNALWNTMKRSGSLLQMQLTMHRGMIGKTEWVAFMNVFLRSLPYNLTFLHIVVPKVRDSEKKLYIHSFVNTNYGTAVKDGKRLRIKVSFERTDDMRPFL